MTRFHITYSEQEKMYSQLELLSVESVDSDKQNVSLAEFDSDVKTQALQRFLGGSCRDVECHVNKYSPGRRATEYYRVSWRQGKKMKHLHIPGGSTIAELANYRADKIRAMIARGAELGEIIAAVMTYRNRKR